MKGTGRGEGADRIGKSEIEYHPTDMMLTTKPNSNNNNNNKTL